MEDGWARLSKDNSSGTGSAYGNVRTEQISTLKPNTGYTLMVEARNVTVSGTVFLKGIAMRSGVGQFSATQTNTLTTTTSAVFYQYGTTLSDFTNLKESTSGYIQINAGASITGDFRFSLYEGEYSGPYKPYVGSQLYASQAELKVVNDNINFKVSKNDVINQINVSTEGVQIDASKVEINGTAIFSAISSDVDSAITGKGYQTSSQVESAITSKGYATTSQAQSYADTAEQNAKAAIPTDISDLNNDSGFITSADVVQN